MQDFSTAVFSDHALLEMARRSIDKTTVTQILALPDAVHDVRPGRVVVHKRYVGENGQKMLLYRVFIDIDRLPMVVVTAYKTSKIAKYETLQ